MANQKKRLLIAIFGAEFFLCLGVLWIIFNREARNALAQRTTAFSLILVCFCVVSIFAIRYIAKRVPRFAVALAFIASYFFLLAVYAVASLLLEIDNIWVDGLHYLILVLPPVLTFILVWQGVKKTNDHKEREGKKEGG